MLRIEQTRWGWNVTITKGGVKEKASFARIERQKLIQFLALRGYKGII